MPRMPSGGAPDPTRSELSLPSGNAASERVIAAGGVASEVATSPAHASGERILALLRRADWRVIEDRPRSPWENLAVDEALLESVRAGRRGPTLRLWEWTSAAVVLGRFQSITDEVDQLALQTAGAHVVRRVSGGGAMWIRPGESITWSLYLPDALLGGAGIRESYEPLDRWAVETLQDLGAGAWYRPLNDIAGPMGKIAGAAQARRPGAVLHHTTAAYRMNEEEMRRLLRLGRERKAPKGTRSADQTVDPLSRQIPHTYAGLRAALLSGFAARFRVASDTVAADEETAAAALLRDRYTSRNWLEIVP